MTLLIYLYLLTCLIFPALDFKKYIFLIIIIYWTIEKLNCGNKGVLINKTILTRIFLIALILLMSTYVTALNSPENMSNAFFIITAMAGLVLSLILAEKNINALNILNNSCVILSIIIMILVLSMFFFEGLFVPLSMIFESTSAGFLGARDFGDINLVMVHFRTSPILIVPLLCYLYEYVSGGKAISNIAKITIVSSAIFYSASRGLIIASLFGILIILIFHSFKLKKAIISLVFIAALSVFLYGYLTETVTTNMFDIEQKGNYIKYNHIISFFDYINLYPDVLLTGAGLGSAYYTAGVDGYAWQTEVTLFDMIRYFGLFGSFIFISLILIPIKRTSHFIFFYTPFFLYFLNALTNPLIFNSTGAVVISIFWANQLFQNRQSLKHASPYAKALPLVR